MNRRTMIALIACLFALGASGSAMAASKRYVLRHPGREHCKAHYVKKTVKVKKHGRKIKETVCQRVTPKPKSQSKKKSNRTPEATNTPIATTTTLSATAAKACEKVEGPNKTFGICLYTVNYQVVASNGEAAPGEIVIKERVPPSQEERTVDIPVGDQLGVGWWATRIGTECTLNTTLNKVEQPSYACEKQNPRMVLVAEYIPSSPQYLASKSEPVTLQ